MSSANSPHPYRNLPSRAFWMRTVAQKNPMELGEWYEKKFEITQRRIATAGSCFAQHIGRNLREKGFKFVDMEPAPAFMARASHLDYGYGMYSARYGNVYTTRQLLQLFDRAFGEFTPVERAWEFKGGVVDPFRPTIEPEPFADIDELEASREHHLACVRRMFTEADVFVFTLGLTEAWTSVEDGSVFPIAPGVSGGTYDTSRYVLQNLTYPEVMEDMKTFIRKVRAINDKMRFLLTVSPVPLMATATPHHVVTATTYSKAVLRAVAGDLAEKRAFVDYFPSFEIISSHIFRGQFYNPDMRTVADYGVAHVMAQFFGQHTPPAVLEQPRAADAVDEDDVKCDEELLAAFGAPR